MKSFDRKQINVVSTMLKRWCANVMRSKVEPMKKVAGMIRKHFDDVIARLKLARPTASSKPSMAS